MEAGKIRTFSGIHFDVQRPRPEHVVVEDIAHHLALENRWNGATRRPLPVGEHSVWVARYVRFMVPFAQERLAMLYALLHDAHEAYLKDLPTPLKMLWPGYEELQKGIDQAIWSRFNLMPPSDGIAGAIKAADSYAAWCEAKVLVAPCRKAGSSGVEPPMDLEDKVGMLQGLLTEPGWRRVETTWKSEFGFTLGQAL